MLRQLPFPGASPGFLLYEFQDGRLLFARISGGGEPGRPAWAPDDGTAQATARLLSERKLVLCFYGQTHCRKADGSWAPARPPSLGMHLADRVSFVLLGAPLAPDQIAWPNTVLEAEGSVAAVDHLTTLGARKCSFPRGLAESLCCPGVVGQARGRLKHPVHGTPSALWLTESDALELPEADPTYPHLNHLYSSWEFDAPSHVALYSYLFGAFSAVSLDQPRPLLFVDSWEQGVGKSIVGEAVGVLVDGEARTLSLDDQANARDEIVARLVSGDRVLSIPNLSHRRRFNNVLLATLCTDGGQGARPKYGTSQAVFYGTLGITSAVLGSVTLHPDLITRTWRVALPGRAQPSVPVVPSEYAQTHRRALIAEIMDLHRRAPPYVLPPTTRFGPFEQAGLGPYCMFTGVSTTEARDRMERAERARWVYLDEVLRSLFIHRKDAFVESFQGWIRDGGVDVDTLARYDGAHALGYTLKDGEWS